MGDLVPPDPPLAGVQTALRPFRVGDAAAIAESCRDPDIPRFTIMPEAMTEDQARQWVERGLEWWPRGLARFVNRPGFHRGSIYRVLAWVAETL